MMYYYMANALLAVLVSLSRAEQQPDRSILLSAEQATINAGTTTIVDDKRLRNGSGITLKEKAVSAVEGEREIPDVVFEVDLTRAGQYTVSSSAITDEVGTEQMKKSETTLDGLYVRIQVDEHASSKQLVYVPWRLPGASRHLVGKFDLAAGRHKIKIWLPKGIRLDYIEMKTYEPPQVPEKASRYKPGILPPVTRPRLWVSQETLPMVKSRLGVGENKAAWQKVRKIALEPFIYGTDDREAANNDAGLSRPLEKAAEAKAFYYLMTGDAAKGREAIELIGSYLPDIDVVNTHVAGFRRRLGGAIFTASEVYDWCYGLLTSSEKQQLSSRLLTLAEALEIGWPPFGQPVVNGHGNEEQVSRDLLSMSIAIYDENPLPYQYCSYRILEELVPMKNFEYQSPRHNQGVGYGSLRFTCDMYAAWLYYRMSGQRIFDDQITRVPYFWMYMRLPDGRMLRDGDALLSGPPGKFHYWQKPYLMFLSYTYSDDPILKGEFKRHGGLSSNPVFFLLLNNPDLKEEERLDSLPLTIDFGNVLGGMVARTGWDISMDSDDVIAEIKGGGYHFSNHQHSDAGSVQLYYKGIQLGDIGTYRFYGEPYDMNFNKRSIAHSMMLVVDPDEKFPRTESNDGGTRFIRAYPGNLQELQKDSSFRNGTVLSADFGHSGRKPDYSYFSVDLKNAYSSKIAHYTRTFCFLNLGRADVPSAILLVDDLASSDPDFKKYWQINTLNPPEKTSTGVVLWNKVNEKTGKTHVNLLVPSLAECTVNFLSGPDANSSFGLRYEPRNVDQPEAHGHRVMISPKPSGRHHRFLSVFQTTSGDSKPLPVSYYESGEKYIVMLADRIVCLNKTGELTDRTFRISVPSSGKKQVILTGLEAGDWTVRDDDGKVARNATVAERKHTMSFVSKGGTYKVTRLP